MTIKCKIRKGKSEIELEMVEDELSHWEVINTLEKIYRNSDLLYMEIKIIHEFGK